MAAFADALTDPSVGLAPRPRRRVPRAAWIAVATASMLLAAVLVVRSLRTAPVPPVFENFLFSRGSQLGITISDLEPQLAEYFGTNLQTEETPLGDDEKRALIAFLKTL